MKYVLGKGPVILKEISLVIEKNRAVFLKTYFFPLLTIFFAAGIMFSDVFDMFQELLVVFCVLITITAAFLFNKDKKAFLTAFLILFFFFGAFWSNYHLEKGEELYKYKGSEQNIAGMVSERKSYEFGDIYRLTNLVIGNREAGGDISVLIYGSNLNFNYGDVISFSSELSKPGVNRNPGELNLRSYLRNNGIFLQTAVGEEEVEWIKRTGNPFLKYIHDWRDNLETVIDNNLKEREAAVFKGILLGEQRYLTESDRELFIDYGIMHLLAVSGLHVGFVVIFLLALTRRLQLKSSFELAVLFLGLFLYCALTGFAPPVMRASLMAVIYLTGSHLNKEHKPEISISIAAFILLLLNPLQLFTVSFQMTFAATLGIIYLTPLIEYLARIIGFRSYKKEYAVKAAAVPLAAFTAVSPLVMYYFYRVSLLGPLSSIFLTPFAGIIVILGLVVLSFSIVMPDIIQPVVFFIGGIIFFTLEILTFLKNIFSISALTTAAPQKLTVVAVYLVMIGVFILFRNRENPAFFTLIYKNKQKILVFLIILIILAGSFSFYGDSNKLEITFLDVGQGDAVFILTPSGKSILVDGGEKTDYSDMGKDVVLPYLQYKGIEKLDVIINSHPHNDHLGGLYSVVEKLGSKAIFLPDIHEKNHYDSFLKLAERKNINVEFVSKGDMLFLDNELIIKFLHPSANSRLTLNDASLVMHITHRENSYLFTGDIEKEGLQKIKVNDIESDVLKVPHHGSSYSFKLSVFEKINPSKAVISVGENNRYNHPGEEVVDWGKNAEVILYRTDKHGAVKIKCDGEEISAKTFLKPAS